MLNILTSHYIIFHLLLYEIHLIKLRATWLRNSGDITKNLRPHNSGFVQDDFSRELTGYRFISHLNQLQIFNSRMQKYKKICKHYAWFSVNTAVNDLLKAHFQINTCFQINAFHQTKAPSTLLNLYQTPLFNRRPLCNEDYSKILGIS